MLAAGVAFAVSGSGVAVGAAPPADPVGVQQPGDGGDGGGSDDDPGGDCISDADRSLDVSGPATILIGQSVTVSWNVSQPAGCSIGLRMFGPG